MAKKEKYTTEDKVMAKETVYAEEITGIAEEPQAKENISEDKALLTFTAIDLDTAITHFYNETKGGKAEAFVSADNLRKDLKRILSEMEKESQ